MSDDYIRRKDAIIEMMDNNVDHAQGTDGREAVQILEDMPSADVVPAEELKAEIYKLKHQSEQSFGNYDYYVGYISALSAVEGILAVMDREE